MIMVVQSDRRRSPEVRRVQSVHHAHYLAVYRGLLVGIEQDREAAEALVRSLNFEKLLLWYHDLYRKRQRALVDNRRVPGVHAPGPSPAGTYGEWFEGGCDKQAGEPPPSR